MSFQGDSVVGNFLRVIALILGRLWGDQTKTEANLRTRAEEAAAKKQEAYTRLREAQREGRMADVARYLSAYNQWDLVLKSVNEQAVSERGN